jgi:hypothetical protein
VPGFILIVKTEPQPAAHEAVVEPQVVEKAIEKKAPVETTAKPEDDPFRDDPLSAGE